MTTAHDQRDILRAIDETSHDHAALLASARGLEALMEGTVYPAPGDVARQLDRFGEQLAAHFAAEEREAMYTWLPTERPWLAEPIEELRHQHAALVVSFRQLAADAASASDASVGSELGVRARIAIAAFRQHEAAESSLLQAALKDTRAIAG